MLNMPTILNENIHVSADNVALHTSENEKVNINKQTLYKIKKEKINKHLV